VLGVEWNDEDQRSVEGDKWGSAPLERRSSSKTAKNWRGKGGGSEGKKKRNRRNKKTGRRRKDLKFWWQRRARSTDRS